MRKQLRQAQPREMELIDAYLEYMRQKGGTKATLEGRHEILHRLNRDLPYGIGQTNTEELSLWLYRDDLSQNAKATYWRAIKSFYTWAAGPPDDEPWLDGNPTLRMPPVQTKKGVPRPCTDEQLERILTESPEPIRTWSYLAAYQGLRCVEVSRLDREHITEQNLFVVQGKGNRPRVHDTDPDVWRVVKDLPKGPVARDENGERLTPFEVSLKAAHCFRRQLGLPGVSMHNLRHWLGVNVQRRYRDIRVTQEVLGHVALSSTQIYTLGDEQQQRAARSTLPRFGE
jgi:integrase/recombinase XerC